MSFHRIAATRALARTAAPRPLISTVFTLHKPTVNSHITTTWRSTAPRFFTASSHNPEKPSSSKDDKSSEPPENPSVGQFSFEGLGMSRNVRIIVIVLISIFGTMETVFWVKAIWRWYEGPGEDGEAQGKA